MYFTIYRVSSRSLYARSDSTLYRRLFHLLCYLTLGVGGLCSVVFLVFSDERIKCSVEALKAANAEFTRRRSLLRPADVEDYSAPQAAALAAPPLTASSALLLAGDSATTVQTYGAVVAAENPLVFSKWHQWLGVREFYQVRTDEDFRTCRFAKNTKLNCIVVLCV